MLPLDILWCLFFGLICGGGALAWFGDPRNVGAPWWACWAWALGTIVAAAVGATVMAAMLMPV